MKPTLMRCAKGWLLTFNYIPQPRSFDLFGATAAQREWLRSVRLKSVACDTFEEGIQTLIWYDKQRQVERTR